ncbi:MAG: ATP--guanido phosphotransferase, partial [Planctomycetota bacterium]|nr:ATP--guanido phosphotransferase [Planctomycetota bacterium]
MISSRIRLARNLRGQPFLSSADEQQFGQLERLIRESMENAAMPGGMSYFGMQTMPMLDRQFLVERHLISREHAYGKGPRGVGLAVDETV